jgi:hypothetical protein
MFEWWMVFQERGSGIETKLNLQQKSQPARRTLGPKNLLLGASPDRKRDQIKPSIF